MEYRFSSLVAMDQPSHKQQIELELEKYNFSQFSDRLKFLHSQLISPQSETATQSELYLKAGCRMFAVETGFIAYAMGAAARKTMVFRQNKRLVDDNLNDAEEKIFDSLIERDHVLTSSLTNTGVEGGALTYNASPTRHYIGAPISVVGTKYGVLCFLSTLSTSFTTQDIETVQLMAEGVARMIELQNAPEKNKVEEIRGFATAGVKSLDQYVRQARIPEAYGVSGRVVEVLQRRIGKQPLAIDFIAEELTLSKRTLQRRLQQQQVNFAQLRDQVRFHYSIDYLIHQTLSIDGISAALDFSDRTSFTNAFKRWTSLSPSTFRKLFRDYA
ncbi:helix-turn-helix domain-containing protein [Aurantivibrio infirmus]